MREPGSCRQSQIEYLFTRRAYDFLHPDRRQVCCVHLRCDFRKWADREVTAARVDLAGLGMVRELFACWLRHRAGPGEQHRVQARLASERLRLERALRTGQSSRMRPLRRFCDNLLALGPALWRYARVEGVEPTTNHAQRVLRRRIMWRECSHGSRSQEARRSVERMLTAVQSLRLQGRSVRDYLTQAVTAHRHNVPAPSLLLGG